MYIQEQLIKVAKRENNNKRKYLVINPLQGKNIAVAPEKSLELFSKLSDKIQELVSSKKILVVGFAETATAIGSQIAIDLNSWYIQTTRENIEGITPSDYIYFQEVHSHAPQHKLAIPGLEEAMEDVDTVIFVDDEITTGNTIANIAKIFKQKYPDIQIFAASIVNGMDEENLQKYKLMDIKLIYLVKADYSKFTQEAESYAGDGIYVKKDEKACESLAEKIEIGGLVNPRKIIAAKEYITACQAFWEEFSEKDINLGENILVVGTEEFMYPAMYIGSKLAKTGKHVKTHSSTRSPIAVSNEQNYPLRKRFELASFYDRERTVFIYDVKKYDTVIIFTDSLQKTSIYGENSLVNALTKENNNSIYIVRWKE